MRNFHFSRTISIRRTSLITASTADHVLRGYAGSILSCNVSSKLQIVVSNRVAIASISRRSSERILSRNWGVRSLPSFSCRLSSYTSRPSHINSSSYTSTISSNAITFCPCLMVTWFPHSLLYVGFFFQPKTTFSCRRHPVKVKRWQPSRHKDKFPCVDCTPSSWFSNHGLLSPINSSCSDHPPPSEFLSTYGSISWQRPNKRC